MSAGNPPSSAPATDSYDHEHQDRLCRGQRRQPSLRSAGDGPALVFVQTSATWPTWRRRTSSTTSSPRSSQSETRPKAPGNRATRRAMSGSSRAARPKSSLRDSRGIQTRVWIGRRGLSGVLARQIPHRRSKGVNCSSTPTTAPSPGRVPGHPPDTSTPGWPAQGLRWWF
jgi:hypothetical protein